MRSDRAPLHGRLRGFRVDPARRAPAPSRVCGRGAGRPHYGIEGRPAPRWGGAVPAHRRCGGLRHPPTPEVGPFANGLRGQNGKRRIRSACRAAVRRGAARGPPQRSCSPAAAVRRRGAAAAPCSSSDRRVRAPAVPSPSSHVTTNSVISAVRE